MTLQELEAIRDAVRKQLEGHLAAPVAPGQESIHSLNAIELRTALRTCEQIITAERTSLMKPKGALGPVLVGV